MKRTFFYAASLAFIGFGMTACGASTEDTAEDTAVTYLLNEEATTLKWKGTYAGDGHSHNGTVKISEGSISYKGDTFESGSFIVDMKTIESELTPETGANDLKESISGPGLFNTAQFPNVEVIVNSISDTEINATLKVGGKEVPAKMPVKVKRTDKKLTAKGKFIIDFSAMNAEGFQPGKEKGKENQYIKPGVDFDLNLVMKAEKTRE
ncbi:MAG: YceI family protein [Fluviicola sp.]|jgi:polyisoprenoid-binding protein YceI|uniref:YceI family protein n=1 Tax=Fluviicola sp. TaxID=1917219 RepID=UPI002622B0BF|nr:YceI family protein [Fluviicola sp.]MDF3027578.1 YceI family protein [Fluviicola sp.]